MTGELLKHNLRGLENVTLSYTRKTGMLGIRVYFSHVYNIVTDIIKNIPRYGSIWLRIVSINWTEEFPIRLLDLSGTSLAKSSSSGFFIDLPNIQMKTPGRHKFELTFFSPEGAYGDTKACFLDIGPTGQKVIHYNEEATYSHGIITLRDNYKGKKAKIFTSLQDFLVLEETTTITGNIIRTHIVPPLTVMIEDREIEIDGGL